MSKFLSGRQSNLNLGITSFTENNTVLQTIGKVGIGTSTANDYSLYVVGSEKITLNLDVSKSLNIGENLVVTGLSTFNSLVNAKGGLDVTGHTELDNVNVSGILTTYNLHVLNDFDVYASNSSFYGNLFVSGDVSIGGTSIILDAEEVRIEDKQLVLGFTTSVSPTNNTANAAGIVVASQEGSYLVPLQIAGINSVPNTYKQLIWVKHNTLGAGTTDAWLFNQAVGIGSTLVPNNIRLAVGDVKVSDFGLTARNIVGTSVSTFDLDVDGHTELDNVNISGITTFQDDIYLGNDDRINFGGANDLQIYHDGLNSYVVDGGTGNLYIRGTSSINLENSAGIETYARFNVDGSSELYYDNTKKLETVGYGVLIHETTFVNQLIVSGISTFNGPIDSNNGLEVAGHTELDNVNISGIVTTYNLKVNSNSNLFDVNVSGIATFQEDIYLKDNSAIYFGNQNDLEIYHDGSNSYIIDNGTGDLYIRGTSSIHLQNYDTSQTYANFNINGASELYYSGLKRFETTGIGVSIFSSNNSGIATLSGPQTFVIDPQNVGDNSGEVVIKGSLDVRNHTELDNVNISGIITANQLDVSGQTELDNVNVSGIVTTLRLDVNDYTDLNNINVSGFLTAINATFSGNVTIGGTLTYEDVTNVDAIGLVTARNGIIISSGGLDVIGISTFANFVDINDGLDVTGHTELDQLNVSGVSTFVGVSTFQNNLYVGGNFGVLGTSEFIGIVTFRGGTINLGDSDTDDIVVSGEFASDLVPTVDDTYSLGTVSKQWKDLYINGTIDTDSLIVSGVSTFSGITTVTGPTLFAKQLNVSGLTTFNSNVDLDQALNVDGNVTVTGLSTFVGIVTNQSTIFGTQLSVSGISTFVGLVDANGGATIDNIQIGISGDNEIDTSTGNLTIDSTGGTVTIDDQLVVTGLTTFNSSVDVDQSLNVDGNVSVTGLSTFAGITTVTGPTLFSKQLNVSGVSTFAGLVDANGGADISGQVTLNNTLAVIGVSTFTGLIDANGGLDVAGGSTLDHLNVTGVSTFTGIVDANGGLDVAGGSTLDYLNVTGVSTFTGLIDANGGLDVTGHTELDTINISGVSTFSGLIDSNGGLDVVGGTNLDQLRVTGISTFTNGPVLIGSGTSTGTANQRLQVTGGAYVSGSIGVRTTNPREEVDVIGDIGIQGSGSSNRFVIQHNTILNSLDFVFV